MLLRSTVAPLAVMAALLLRATSSRSAENVPDILRRQTQELVDAIAAGSKDVWDRYLDPDVRVIDETGTVQSKKQMLDQTAPLPAGVTGSIRILDFDAAVHGDVAIATYVDDESENFHGHALHCQYRTTDAWKRTAELRMETTASFEIVVFMAPSELCSQNLAQLGGIEYGTPI